MISNAAFSRFRSMKIPMPAVPLHELFRHSLPDGVFQVCGQPDVCVQWARTITSPTHQMDNMVEGDLALITEEVLSSEPEQNLGRIISQLVPARVRAIGIQGALSVAALEAAAHNDIAVIFIPADTSIEGVERAVIRYIMNKQAELEKLDIAFQQELARQASGNFGLQATIKALAQATDAPVVLHDAQGFRLTHSMPETVTVTTKRWQYHLSVLQDRDLVAHFTDNTMVSHHNATILESDHALSATIMVDSTVVGYLSIIKDEKTISPFVPIALSRGAAVCGLLLAKNSSVVTDQSPRHDWISAWLNSTPAEDLMLTARAEQSAFDSTQVYVMSTMRWLPGNETRRTTKPVRAEQLAEQLRHEIHMRRIHAIVGQYRDRTVLFLPLEKAQHTGRMKQYTSSIASRMAEILGGMVACGVGRPGVGLTELRRSFAEAERAMNLTEQLWTTTQTSFFGDLSLTELLMNIDDYHQMHQFCQDWLSHILNYDQQNNSDLLLTMSVYFANNGNMAATAKQLNVHRNTLVYRLNRIAEITQLDMDDADVQLNLHLAIKAHSLLQRLELD